MLDELALLEVVLQIRSVVCVVLLMIGQTTDTLPRNCFLLSLPRSKALLRTIAMSVLRTAPESLEYALHAGFLGLSGLIA